MIFFRFRTCDNQVMGYQNYILTLSTAFLKWVDAQKEQRVVGLVHRAKHLCCYYYLVSEIDLFLTSTKNTATTQNNQRQNFQTTNGRKWQIKETQPSETSKKLCQLWDIVISCNTPNGRTTKIHKTSKWSNELEKYPERAQKRRGYLRQVHKVAHLHVFPVPCWTFVSPFNLTVARVFLAQ